MKSSIFQSSGKPEGSEKGRTIQVKTEPGFLSNRKRQFTITGWFPVMLILSALMMAACSSNREANKQDALVSHIDSSVVPGDDFFMYANGKWFKQHPIPANEGSNGIFQLIQDTINAQIQNICISAAAMANAEKGSNKQKIGDFYYTGMDSVTINRNGMSDLKELLNQIDQVRDMKGLIQAAAIVHTYSGSPFFRFYITQDDKISSKNAVFINQGGLSLPDRSYYFDMDARAVNTRAQFVKHLERAFRMLGYDEKKAVVAAENEMKLETNLAKISRKSEDTRDPLKNYNKIAFARLNALTPLMDWTLFTRTVGLPTVDTVIVGQPEFFKGFNDALKSYPLEQWKNYLKYHLLHSFSSSLDDSTYNEFFSFYGTTIYGIKEPRPRWKRVVAQTDDLLGELIGQVYVNEYLPKGTKEKLLEIGNSIRAAYAVRIKNLDWMSDVTKEKALAKLNGIIMKVGYPDKWKDLGSLQVDRSSYARNVMNARKWWFNYMINKYGKPVDRTEWGMEPQTYNAYYNPSNNEICVPGCNIIVPGYERKMADDAILYSVIGGSTFGHEITHGFDDQGSKYDLNGNLQNWWTAEDSIRFYAKTRLIVQQYDNYIAVDSLHVNGKLTLGENIADLGGVMIGYDAFRKTKQYTGNQKVAGLTPDQRFFLGYALAWMVNERPELTATQVRSNVHSPAKFRVIGPLSDMTDFYKTFNVKEGNAMWRPDSLRVKIW